MSCKECSLHKNWFIMCCFKCMVHITIGVFLSASVSVASWMVTSLLLPPLKCIHSLTRVSWHSAVHPHRPLSTPHRKPLGPREPLAPANLPFFVLWNRPLQALISSLSVAEMLLSLLDPLLKGIVLYMWTKNKHIFNNIVGQISRNCT